MVHEPLDKLEAYVAAGADIITVQVESAVHIHRVLQRLGSMEHISGAGRGVVRGLALNPGTPLEWLARPVLDEVEMVVLLAVDPGWSGQTLRPHDLLARGEGQGAHRCDGERHPGLLSTAASPATTSPWWRRPGRISSSPAAPCSTERPPPRMLDSCWTPCGVGRRDSPRVEVALMRSRWSDEEAAEFVTRYGAEWGEPAGTSHVFQPIAGSRAWAGAARGRQFLGQSDLAERFR